MNPERHISDNREIVLIHNAFMLNQKNCQSQPARGRNAFTLLELLVVIGIIGILAALLLPAMSSARKKAQQVTCSANLKQLSLLLRLYTDDYNDYLPINYPSSWNTCLYTNYLYKSSVTGNTIFKADPLIFVCPSGANTFSNSQVVGTYACTDAMRGVSSLGGLTSTLARKASALINPSETLLLCEAREWGNNDYSYPNITWAQVSADFAQSFTWIKATNNWTLSKWDGR